MARNAQGAPAFYTRALRPLLLDPSPGQGAFFLSRLSLSAQENCPNPERLPSLGSTVWILFK